MLKKMMLMALAVGALVAFAAPTVAQADVTLTDKVGGVKTALKAGAGVTETSENLIMTWGSNNQFECELVTLHYKVVTNGPNHIVLNPETTHNATFEGCVLSINGGAVKLPAEITEAGTKTLTINTWGTGTADYTFTFNVPAAGLHCNFTGAVHAQAVGDDSKEETELEVGPSALTGAPVPPCPETNTIEGTFNLETSDGTPVTLDYTKTG